MGAEFDAFLSERPNFERQSAENTQQKRYSQQRNERRRLNSKNQIACNVRAIRCRLVSESLEIGIVFAQSKLIQLQHN
jgi:hypothetical protein